MPFCCTVTEIRHSVMQLFHDLAATRHVMLFVTPSFLAVSVCLGPEMEQNGLYLGVESREMWVRVYPASLDLVL